MSRLVRALLLGLRPVIAPRDVPGGGPQPTHSPHPDLDAYYAGSVARRPFVTRLFDRSAASYDGIVGSMALGSGRWYRRKALERAGIGPGMRVLDVAIGTGLLAREARRLCDGHGAVIGLDLSYGMLREARKKVAVPLLRGLAEELPLAPASVDAVTMGYALRHVADLRATFGEFLRVLRPGGVVLLLELSRPANGTAAYSFTRFYLRALVPSFAQLLRGREAATMMRYFWDTIDGCVPPQAILDALSGCGFATPARVTPMGPVFSEYLARKPC